MRRLRRLFGIRGAQPEVHIPVTHLHPLVDDQSAISVVPITNGFIVMRREHNPTGPDPITAAYAPDGEELAKTVIAMLAVRRLTKP
jgi:hypothetical protein